MADNGKKSTDRAEAIILTDPEEMRKARFDQPLLSSAEKKRQRQEMLANGMSDFPAKSKSSKSGLSKAVAS